MSNRRIWDRVYKPDASALKTIGGGRLKGMTDINPQWRLQAATEVFGPCGTGWWYTIKKLWTVPGADGQVIAFARVAVFYRDGEVISQPVEGIGGSMMVSKESSGLYTNDECYKMAVTDALSVAFKALGFGAEIYAGRWDGSKYKDTPAPKEKSEEEKKIHAFPQKTKDGLKAMGYNSVAKAATFCAENAWDVAKIDAALEKLASDQTDA